MKEVVAAHRALGHNVRPSTLIRMGFDSPVKASAMRAEEHLGRVAARLSETLPGLGAPPGYQYKLLHLARRALAMLDSSVRGGHSPCALAATSFYAAEMAVSESESRKRFFTQRDAANCVNVAEYTVREQFCELFRPRWDEIYDELRPMLSSQSHGPSSQSSCRPLDSRLHEREPVGRRAGAPPVPQPAVRETIGCGRPLRAQANTGEGSLLQRGVGQGALESAAPRGMPASRRRARRQRQAISGGRGLRLFFERDRPASSTVRTARRSSPSTRSTRALRQVSHSAGSEESTLHLREDSEGERPPWTPLTERLPGIALEARSSWAVISHVDDEHGEEDDEVEGRGYRLASQASITTVRQGRSRGRDAEARAEEGRPGTEPQPSPWTTTPITRVALLASAAEAQIARRRQSRGKADRRGRGRRRSRSRASSWAASTAASLGATGLLSR